MKTILSVFVALFVVNTAFSQQTKFGIKVGANISSLTDVVDSELNSQWPIYHKDGSGTMTGFHAGVFLNASFGLFLGFQPELLFSMQGGRLTHTYIGSPIVEDNRTFKFGYINIPLLLEIKPVANLGILVGPQIGFNVSRKAKSLVYENFSGSDFDLRYLGVKKIDVAFAFGLQYTIQDLTFGVRYNYGLTNNHDVPTSYEGDRKGWKNRVFQFSLGYAF